MYTCLSPGAIRVQSRNLAEALAAARTGGFDAVEVPIREAADLADARGVDAVREPFEAAGVRPGGWGLPVDWRTTDANWRRDVDALPRLARTAQALGCPRTFTWVLSFSDERPFAENLRFHVERFRPVAQILADHGCPLGLEFLGPKTLRAGKAHEFVHTQDGMLEMAAQIGPNVGLLLDCWHWYTSHGAVDDLRRLRPEQVVYVHINDAPAGIAIDEQVDNVRDLPGATGVIPLSDFLGTLDQIGYDGPVTPEPFAQSLADLPDDAARLRTVGAAMTRAFADAGLRR
jgi:sugar phosphate isomerase/epimerase